VTPERFRECMKALGWDQRFLADRLGINPRTIERWYSGAQPVPPNVGEWLEDLVRALEERPLPKGWT
jgi:transcriptional regulator with XRE-family HTH domain